jgi:hypothetical protein
MHEAVMCDNAGENRSEEILDFFKSKGIRNHFSTSRDKWQNRPAEVTINSILLTTRILVVMAESGLEGRIWFKTATAGVDARNATFNTQTGTTNYHWHLMYDQKKGASGFQAFGCRAWAYLNQEQLAKGKQNSRAAEPIYNRFANIYNYIPEMKKIVSTKQVKLSEHEFPSQKVSYRNKVHHNKMSYVILLQVAS